MREDPRMRLSPSPIVQIVSAPVPLAVTVVVAPIACRDREIELHKSLNPHGENGM
jgi:hypothetical protein